ACKELLTTSDLSVTQIASSAGFSSQSYFSQIFNKEVGMSPRQYRKLYSHEKKE
ncbi:helix-turn-helix domain-containing protein, partial [Lachnospiraceae bacterium SGI.240]